MLPLFKLDRARIEALIARAEAFDPRDEELGFSMALSVRDEHLSQIETALIERGYAYDILDARRRPWTLITVYPHAGVSPAAAQAVVKSVLEYAAALRGCQDEEVQAHAHNLIRYFADQEVYRETRNQRAVFFGAIDDRGCADTYLVVPNGKVEVVTNTSNDLDPFGYYFIDEDIFVNGCFIANRETSGFRSLHGADSKVVWLRMGEEDRTHSLWTEKERWGEIVTWEHPTGATFECPPDPDEDVDPDYPDDDDEDEIVQDEGVIIEVTEDDGTVTSEFVPLQLFNEWWEQNKD
jgi:hypothetical protein